MRTLKCNYKNTSELTQTQSNYTAWLVVALCASLLFYKYVLNVFPSVMTDELIATFHVSGASLGNLAAFFFYAYLITQLFVGVLLDRFGSRYLAGIATLIAASGVFIFAYSHEFTTAAIGRCMMGIGAAFATVTYLKVTTTWFRVEQRAFVGGLLATAVMLGAVFGEAPLAWLVDQWGWRASLLLCGTIGLVIALLFLCCVRDKPQTSEQAPSPANQLCWQDIKQVLKNPQNWLLTLYSGFAFAPFATLGGLWGNPFLQAAYDSSRTQAGFLISMSFIGFGLGGPALGFLSDRLGERRPIMQLGLVLSLIPLLLTIYIPMNLIILACCLFLFGFGTGTFMLGFTLGRELNKALVAATVIALINTGDALMGAISEPLVGKLLDLNFSGAAITNPHAFPLQDYHYALLPLPLYLILAFVFLSKIRKDK